VLDTNGNVIGRQGHLPFGEGFGESGSQEEHHFTSYERDGEAGTDYAVNRQYSQSTGRFNRPDPLAASGKDELPQTWNRYSYTTGDPINQKDPWGLFGWGGPYDDPCGPFGPVVILDGIELVRDFFGFTGPIPAPPSPEPPERTPCRDQDFSFVQHSGRYTSIELQALAQMAVGEAGGFFDRKEIEAVISTAVNRQNYNIAYLSGGASRGPFNGGTTILGILEAGYDAHNRGSGQRKLDQAKALTGGVLYEGDYVCDQLKAAKDYAKVVGTLTPEQVIAA
jgi:RHS repeat-associated protein